MNHCGNVELPLNSLIFLILKNKLFEITPLILRDMLFENSPYLCQNWMLANHVNRVQLVHVDSTFSVS